MDTFILYRIEFVSTDKFYIGSTKNFLRRKERHLSSLRHNKHPNIRVQKLFNKVGEANTKFIKVREYKEEVSLRKAEQRLLNKFIGSDCCLNIGDSSIGGNNISWNPKRKEILLDRYVAQMNMISSLSKEERASIYDRKGHKNGMFGKQHSKEAKKKISKANKGRSINAGIPKSDEHRKNISAAAKKTSREFNIYKSLLRKSTQQKLLKKLSDLNKLRFKDPNNLPTNRLRVKINNTIYESASKAAKAVGCAVATIRNRIMSGKFSHYSYVD